MSEQGVTRTADLRRGGRAGINAGRSRDAHGCLTAQTNEARVLAAIEGAWCVWGRPPSLRELADALGLDSASALMPWLDRLEADGKIEREPFAGPGAGRTVWPKGLREGIRGLARVLAAGDGT